MQSGESFGNFKQVATKLDPFADPFAELDKPLSGLKGTNNFGGF